MLVFSLFIAINQSNGKDNSNETPPTQQTTITHYFAVTR